MNIGLQLSIPLFSGLEQTYQIREAQAQAAAHVAELDTVRLRVSEDVWTQYNTACVRKRPTWCIPQRSLISPSKPWISCGAAIGPAWAA